MKNKLILNASKNKTKIMIIIFVLLVLSSCSASKIKFENKIKLQKISKLDILENLKNNSKRFVFAGYSYVDNNNLIIITPFQIIFIDFNKKEIFGLDKDSLGMERSEIITSLYRKDNFLILKSGITLLYDLKTKEVFEVFNVELDKFEKLKFDISDSEIYGSTYILNDQKIAVFWNYHETPFDLKIEISDKINSNVKNTIFPFK